MVELPPESWTKITVKFLINYKPALQKIEDLLKSSLKIIVFLPEILPKKLTLMRFIEEVYKIRAVTIFLILAILVLKYPSPELT